MSLDRRFNYNYRYNPSHYGDKQHAYEVIGRDGAIHFHVTESVRAAGDTANSKLPRHYGGLEEHRRTCPDHTNRPPSHHDCRLLGGICWHDGTSLYASEVLIPRWLRDYPNHDAVFGWLIHEFDSRFGGLSERA